MQCRVLEKYRQAVDLTRWCLAPAQRLQPDLWAWTRSLLASRGRSACCDRCSSKDPGVLESPDLDQPESRPRFPKLACVLDLEHGRGVSLRCQALTPQHRTQAVAVRSNYGAQHSVKIARKLAEGRTKVRDPSARLDVHDEAPELNCARSVSCSAESFCRSRRFAAQKTLLPSLLFVASECNGSKRLCLCSEVGTYMCLLFDSVCK